MPRAAAVYEEKLKWALPEMDWEGLDHLAVVWADNYKSAKAIGPTLQAQLEEGEHLLGAGEDRQLLRRHPVDADDVEPCAVVSD